VNRLLGTEITAVPGDGPAVLLSDLHVPAGGGRVVALLQRALRFAASTHRRVFVLGDLFDSYIAAAQVKVGVWRDVAAQFAAVTAAGVPVFLLPGNRDFLLGREFSAVSGVQLVVGGIATQLAGRRAVLLHGDELCQDDHPYQRAKRWLRHPLTRGLARRLPLPVALWVADKARRQSQRVIRSGDQQRFDPTVAAVDAVFASGAELLVFGHIHRPSHGHHGSGEYWVLPAFDEAGICLAADADALRSCDQDGVRQPEPAAASWLRPAAG
jgi:UDP-2,3-diacylglucosamine hydrolase